LELSVDKQASQSSAQSTVTTPQALASETTGGFNPADENGSSQGSLPESSCGYHR
jgi:hypothetical protein